jgi:hypothetical protein
VALLTLDLSERGSRSDVLERCGVSAECTTASSLLLMAGSDVERTDELRISVLDR